MADQTDNKIHSKTLMSPGSQRSMKIEGHVIARAEGPKQSLNVAGFGIFFASLNVTLRVPMSSHPPDARNDSGAGFSGEKDYKFKFSKEEFDDFIRSGGGHLRPRLQRSAILSDIQSGMRVLDIGCGKGEILINMAKQGARAVGLDISLDALLLQGKLSSSVLPDNLKENICYMTGDATRLPFNQQTFDRILMLDIIEHLPPDKLEMAIKEAHRCLKKDGYVILHTVPNRWALRFGYPMLRLLNPSLPADPRIEAEKRTHINEQDIIKLGKVLSLSGLKFKLWLENMTALQAVVARERDYSYEDLRPRFYRALSKWYIRYLLIFALYTPFKFIICNDIYGLAWHHDAPEPEILKKVNIRDWMERFILKITKYFPF